MQTQTSAADLKGFYSMLEQSNLGESKNERTLFVKTNGLIRIHAHFFATDSKSID